TAIERLARAWGVQTEEACGLGDHDECVGDAPRVHDRASRPDAAIAALPMDQELALDDVHHLVVVRVVVQRRCLSAHQRVLEHAERPVGLLRGRLPGVDASPVEPELVAFALRPDDRGLRCHFLLLLHSWYYSTTKEPEYHINRGHVHHARRSRARPQPA